MIRRHFLCTTCSNVLCQIYDRFASLIRGAEFVCMMQDGISREDIQFYTELNDVQCEDRSVLSATQLLKPTVIHPIKYTSNSYNAMIELCHCYRDSFHNGTCQQPFMVFCSSVHHAQYIVDTLKNAARQMHVDEERIQGIWSALRGKSHFLNRFSADPNGCASEADVIVCTSVIGAGFSISAHFHSFHGFLFNNILNHQEEKQFIRRLRFVMENIIPGRVRQSYLYIEKGRGVQNDYYRVLEDYKVVRNILLNNNEEELQRNVFSLESTQAQIATRN